MNKIAEKKTERFEAANADFRTALVYFSLAFTHIFRAAKHLLSGIALSLVVLFLAAPAYAATIWSEDFTYANDTAVGTGNKWTIDRSLCDAVATFSVQNNRFMVHDTGGATKFGWWISESIDISGYTDVTISADWENESLDNNTEYIEFYVNIDGGGDVLWADPVTHVAAESGTVSTTTINGSTLVLKIKAQATFGTSEAYWDNITITGLASGAADTTPPAAISNLTALGGLHNRMTLKWTAPGDDGTGSGNVDYFTVKYSSNYISADDWSASWVTTWGNISTSTAYGTEELHTITGLFSEGTTYWFAVKAYDGANWGVWPGTTSVINKDSFCLPISSAPAAITTLSALTGSSSGEVELTWTAPGDDGTTGAITGGKFAIRYATYTNVDWKTASAEWTDFDEKYELVIDTDTNNYNEVHSRTMTGLRAGVEYYFRLKTADEQPNWSALSNHATAQAYSVPPLAPSALAQYDPDWNEIPWGDWINYQQVRATFTLSDPDGNDMQFNIQFSTYADFSYSYVNSTYPDTASLKDGATNYLTTLLPEGTWFWKVKAIDEGGLSSPYSSATVANDSHFRIDITPPTNVGLSTPANNEEDVEALTSLEALTATDGLSGGVQYYFEMDEVTTFDSGALVNSGWLTGNSWSTATLAGKTTYYWRVKAKDAVGNESDFSGHSADVAGYGKFSTTYSTANMLTDALHDWSFEDPNGNGVFWSTNTATEAEYGSTAQQKDRAQSFKWGTVTGDFSGRYITLVNFATGIEPETPYVVSCWWMSSSASFADQRLKMQIGWYDSEDTPISSSESGEFSLSAQTSWEYKASTHTAPAGAVKAKIVIYNRHAGTSGINYIDAVSLHYPGNLPPDAPTNFAGAAMSSTTIKWTWTDNSAHEDGFEIRSSIGGVLVSSDTLTADTTYYYQTGLTANTSSYYYNIYAVNAEGYSSGAQTVPFPVYTLPAGIWAENFGSYADGTQAGTEYRWTVSTGACDAGATFSVQSGRFEVSATGGSGKEGEWITESIDIGNHTNLQISFDWETVISFGTEGLWAYYNIDGGGDTLFFSTTSTSGSGTVQESIPDGTSVVVKIKAQSSAGTRFVYWDDVVVNGDPAADNPPDAPSKLAQYDSDWNAIPWGGWTKYQNIRATFTLSDPDGDDMQFNIQFSTHSNFAYSYVNSTNPATATLAPGATNYLTPLLSEGTWYWRVMATDNAVPALSSAYASSNTVTAYQVRIDTTPPTGLANTSPLNNSTELENSTTLICGVAVDILSGGVEYYFEIDTTTAFNGSGKQNSGWQAGTSYSPTLSYNTIYYWRVKAKDAAGNETDFTSEWQFVTKDIPLYSISGTILDSLSRPLVGVTVILSSGAYSYTTTDASGYYEFTGLFSSDYVVTPSSATRYFSPANYIYGSLSADQSGQNFTGTECYGNQFMIDATSSLLDEPLIDAAGKKLAIRFMAKETASVTGVRVYDGRSGTVNYTIRVGIQADSGGKPSGTYIGTYHDEEYVTDYAFAWKAYNNVNASLTAGNTYYVVFEPSAYTSGVFGVERGRPLNFSSAYDLKPDPYSNFFSSTTSAGWVAHDMQPIYILDGINQGNPYARVTTAGAAYSVRGSTWVGSEFVVRGSTIGVDRISFYVRKYNTIGDPEDSLYYELRGPDSFDTVIEAGTFAAVDDVSGTGYSWVSKALAATRGLAKDSKYWIMLKSPATTGATVLEKTYLISIGNTVNTTSIYMDLTYQGQTDGLLAKYWSDADAVTTSNQRDVAFRLDVVDPLGDIYPPAAISNLTALAGAYGGEIQLKWSAPGDNDMLGDNSAGSYLVKYSTQYISSANFDANWVSTYTQSWTPSSTPGSEELKILTGFTEGVTYWFVMKTSDGEGNWSVWNSSGDYAAVNSSNSVAATREAPSAITNLSAFLVSALTSGEVRLSWTAPGDDGTKAGDSGGPSSYIIRFSTNAIGDGDWDASWVSNYSTAPAHIGNYGETEIMTLTQMVEAATYYFRIKSLDDAGNVSAIDTTAVKAFCDMRPDLLITESDIQSSNYFPEAMDIIFITATVRNIGSAYRAGDSTWTAVMFYLGDPSDGGTPIAYYHANSSPSYNQSFEAYSGAWQIPEGSHKIYVVVDSSETITERSENNNTAYINIEAPPIPPAAISNLTAFLNGASEGQIKLKWTAPGDDGMEKADCAGYLVKYADKYISAADFYASWVSTYTQTWTPAAFGTEENRTLEGFTPGVTYWFVMKAYDGVPNYGVWTSSGDNAAVNTLNSSYAQWDITPPASISNLTALTGTLDGEVRLVWTAPGDDGWTGDIVGGELKILASTYSITTANFDSITENPYYTHLRAMTTSYSTQATEHSYTMTGLYAGTTYYFALKVADDAGNWSFWSYSGANTKSTAPAQDLPPEIISNFTATAGQEKITLAWTEPDLPDLAFYRVYRDSTTLYDFEDAYVFDVLAGNNSYEDTGLEVGVEHYYRVETFDLGDGADGLYSVVLSSAYSSVVSATPMPPPDSGAMVVYYSTPTALQNTPLYRTLEKGTTEWAAEAQSNNVGASVQYWHILKNSPVLGEKILITLDADEDVNAQKWSGSSWGAVTELTADAGTYFTRVVDGEYEHSSGDFLVVYRNAGNAVPVYRTLAKGSDSWSAPANVPHYGLTGAPAWIRLESRLGTDDIMLVVSDANADLFAILWDGSQWVQASSTTLTTALSHGNQSWDVACEYQSGNFFVAYGTGTSYTVAYRRFLSASSSWEDANYMLTAEHNVRWVKLASEKRADSNYILAGALDNSSYLAMIVWDGSAFGAKVRSLGTLKSNALRAFDVAWEATSETKGIVVYSRGLANKSPKYMTVSGTAVSGVREDSIDVAATGHDPAVIRLEPDPNSNHIWCLYNTFNAVSPNVNAVAVQRWKGWDADPKWDGDKVLTSTSVYAVPYENFSIAYGTYPAPVVADTAAPAAITTLSASTYTLTGQVQLQWEAPGDDGWEGTLGTSGDLARFGIKYATYTAFNWGSPENFDISIDTYGVNPYDIQTQIISLNKETTHYFRIWTRDEASAGNWSDISLGATVWARIAPAAITTLSALANDEGDVHLSWIAPGDDGTTGTITDGQWKIRYSTLSTVDWATASAGWTDEKNKYEILIDTSAAPLSEHSRGITDLSLRGGVTYYFRIWTRDEATGANAPGNWSEISNGSTATVVKILGVSVSTDSYNFGEVPLSGSSVAASGITVTNTGNTEQDYSLVISSITLFDNSPSVWKSTDTSPGLDRFLLYAIFHGAEPEASYFVNKDTVTMVSATSSDEIFTYDGGATGDEQAGAGVPAADDRSLWLKIDMPTTVLTSKTQRIRLRISAGASQ